MNKLANKKLSHRKKLNHRWLYFLPALTWAGIIFVFSAQQVLPGFNLSLADFLLKKTGHMLVYGLLYWLLYWALSKTYPNLKYKWLIGLSICLIYGLSDELHQSFVSGRSASLRDVGFDILGSSLVILKQFDYI